MISSTSRRHVVTVSRERLWLVSLDDHIGVSVDSANNPQSMGRLRVTYSTGPSTTGQCLPGINLQHRTTLREWYYINDFADALSHTILGDLHVPHLSSDFRPMTRKLQSSNNHNRQQQLVAPRLTLVGQSALGDSSIASLLEATASRLEQVIMREVFSSAFLLLRPKPSSLPLSLCPPSLQYTLFQFAQNAASQAMQKACQSAKRRMRAIRLIADSVLCSLALVTTSDFHSSMMNVAPTLLDKAEPAEAIKMDHSPSFGCFASRLAS